MENIEKQLVLIVDDQPANLQVLAELVEKAKYQTALALNGKEAVVFAMAEIPDLILLDIMMPEMDGYEVCRILKSNSETKDIPIIFISAKNRDEEETLGLELGGADYITKPYSPGIVLARIKNQIQLGIYKKELKKHIKELETSKEELDKANREKDRLFSIIAHDLRNPFSVVLGLSDLMVKRGDVLDKEKMISYAQKIFEAGGRVCRLFENLLEWANMQLGIVQYNPSSFELSPVIQECIELLSESAELKNIKIINNSSNYKAFADKNMISTVIRNILNNAIKFTQSQGKITINTTLVDTAGVDTTIADAAIVDSTIVDTTIAGNMIEVGISDTGTGMDSEVLDNIFCIKKKASTPGTNGEVGSGLGLLLCKDMIDKNRGKILIESKVGVGTKICFTLPLCNEKNTEREGMANE